MVRSTPEVRKRLREMRMWTNDTELLAQILEVGSVIASRHQMAKPREIPRPDWMTPSQGGNGFQHAINVLRSTARTVRR